MSVEPDQTGHVDVQGFGIRMDAEGVAVGEVLDEHP